jgi:hypothetical protein
MWQPKSRTPAEVREALMTAVAEGRVIRPARCAWPRCTRPAVEPTWPSGHQTHQGLHVCPVVWFCSDHGAELTWILAAE